MLNRKKSILIIVGLVILVVLILVIKQFIVINPENEISEEYTPEQEITDQDYRKTIVTLYFKEKANGNLVQEGRLIDAKLLLENPYETLLQMLIMGPEATSYERLIPEGTMLNKVELKGEVLEIDFTKEFLNFDNNEEKDKILESIKKTVVALNEVNEIKVFVDGQDV